MRHSIAFALAAFASVLVAGCIVEDAPEQDQQPQANAQAAPPAVDPAIAAARARARAEVGELRFLVDVSDRRLQLFAGDRALRTERVAVGSDEYPTPLGRWIFDHVDINPDWTPPDSEWAEEREAKDPGEEGNPMGRARLVYNREYTIHGTEDTASLGTNQSHGSIRVANPVVLELAQMLLKAGGVWEGDQWFAAMTADPTRMHRIELDHPIAIEIVE